MKTKTPCGSETISNAPCENCLLISACRHKYYMQLLSHCELITKYLYTEQDGGPGIGRNKDFWERIAIVSKLMKPVYWDEGKSSDNVDYFMYHKSAKDPMKTTHFKYKNRSIP